MPRTTYTPDGRELVHHSRCGLRIANHPDRVHADGSVCQCPPSWPRLKKDALIAHRWNGNCLRTEARPERMADQVWELTPRPACLLHGEPRGSCSHCKPCGGCEAGRRAQDAMSEQAFRARVVAALEGLVARHGGDFSGTTPLGWSEDVAFAIGLDDPALAAPYVAEWFGLHGWFLTPAP